ncbi:MAG: toll/interleukin receptor protein [Segetibacter sp.]|nr:toll/interleukin receptor protein [Segetibacter sp.]
MINNLSSKISWDVLMEKIAEGSVIPIIGNEMFKLKEQEVTVDNFLKRQLEKENDIQENSTNTLSETISYLMQQGQDIDTIISSLKRMAGKIDAHFPALHKLLQIEKLNFFTNTTVYSTLIEKQILKSKGQSAKAIDFSICSTFEDCEDIETLSSPVIFNVFGSFKSVDPALRDEEMLEFTTSFKERMLVNAPDILNAFKNKTLLFLGCSQPDWLIRFFLRVISNERMNDWVKRRNKIIVVNDASNHRQKQYEFFKNYNAKTYEGNTKEFIDELTDNWNLINPTTVKPKVIFLSYTHKDAAAVENVKQALMQVSNLTCWYDKERLRAGDNYEDDIIDNIRNADLFIPLISKNCLVQEDRYVLKEWLRATDTYRYRLKGGKADKYLMPIVIDNTDLDNKIIKDYYKDLSIEPVPEGKMDNAFIDRVKEILKLS